MGKTSWIWLKLVGVVMIFCIFMGGALFAQTESQEIYIYVTLRQPDCGPPPDSIEISSVTPCGVTPEEIVVKASRNPGTNEWFNVYRDIAPILWISRVNELERIGITTVRNYYDQFTDTLWFPYGSKGICDCDINYFYTMTTGDTLATGDTCESAYPSNCAGEFDFCLESPAGLTHLNNIVYTLVRGDIRSAGNTGAALAQTIGGSSTLKRWNAASQVWIRVAYWADFPPPGGWVSPENVELLHPYMIDGDALDPIWSMQVPGLVPPDPHFDLVHNTTLTSWNMISLPFYEQQISFIETGCDLYENISGAQTIKRWNATSQVWIRVAYYSSFPPPGGCVNLENVRAGYPYFVDVSTSSTWPYSAAR